MRTLLRCLSLVLVVALAGCAQQQTSTGDFKGADKAVAQTLEDLESNAQSRKPGAICSSVLSRALADRLKAAGSDCTAEMEKVTTDADDYRLKVTDVTISGNTATAKVESRRGDEEKAITTYSLVREDGEWRLNDLGSS